MKGIVFNLLQEVVVAEHGEAAWDALLTSAGLDGAYTSLGTYDDAQLLALVAAASQALGLSERQVVRWFGVQAMPLFAERYPALFAAHDNARDFVLTLNDIIHPEVRKLYPGADVPEFDFDAADDEVLGMTYSSARKMCDFAEGLIEGAASHYGQHVDIEQPECMHDGAAHCRFRLRFRSPA